MRYFDDNFSIFCTAQASSNVIGVFGYCFRRTSRSLMMQR
jgi:hypothetical protein